MKVLLINSEHARIGGAHTVYFNTAEMLRSVGVDVIFFALHSAKEIECEQSAYFSERRSKKNAVSYLRKRFYNKDAAACLQRLLDAEHPDIAHVHLMWGSLSPSILDILRKNGVPVVHTVHDYAMICPHVTLRSTNGGYVCERCAGGHFMECVKTRCHGGSLKKSLVAAAEIINRDKRHHPADLIDRFIFVTNFCANKHSEMDARFRSVSKSLLYNVPDLLVEKKSEHHAVDSYQSYYLYYGRLSYEKGLDTLISAFIEMPDLKLKIVGTGPLESSLKARCKTSGATNIEFLGFRSGEELYELVQKAKFVCAPSEWYENGPMTVIECFTLGTPAIGSRIGGIPELITDGVTGFLHKPASKDAILQTVRKAEMLEKGKYDEMKEAAKADAMKRFNRGTYVRHLYEVYKETISEYRK